MEDSFIQTERAKHLQEKHFTIVPNKVFRDLADYCLRTNNHEQSFVALFLYARLLDGIYGNDYNTTSTPHDLSKLAGPELRVDARPAAEVMLVPLKAEAEVLI